MSALGKGPSSPTHLAAGSALGYVFQLQVALVELLGPALAQEEASVCLEVLDDISLEHQSGKAPKLIQVHQSTGSRQLTDASPKVWRTLGIWASHWERLESDESLILTLHTTQTVQDESGIAALTLAHRDVGHALERLDVVAGDTTGSRGTADDRKLFLQLSEAERRALLSAVTVVDGAAPPVDARAELIKGLMGTNEAQYVPSMADVIDGWWWGRIPEALATKEPILSAELRAQVDEARRMHSANALPIFKLDSFDAGDLPDFDPASARFMQCLLAIKATQERCSEAAEDYQLSGAHRSRWVRRGLIGVGEMDRFDDNLRKHWRISSERMLRHLADQEDENLRARTGHDLWDEMEQASLPPLRRDTPDKFIQRGTFHQLADDKKVAWHPDSVGEVHIEDGDAER